MTDWIADAESGASVREKLNLIREKGNTETITTGASTVDANLDVMITRVITGGTAGDEAVRLPNFAFGPSGALAPDQAEKIHIVVLDTLTNPADRVSIIPASGSFKVVDALGNRMAIIEISLSYVDSYVLFRWTGEKWAADLKTTTGDVTLFNAVSYVPENASADSKILGNVGNASSWLDDLGAENSVAYTTTGSSPSNVPGAHTCWFASGGTGAESVTDIGPPTATRVGLRKLLLVDQFQTGDTITFDLTHIKANDGSDLTSIIFTDTNTIGHFVLVEAWDATNWRVVRATPGIVT